MKLFKVLNLDTDTVNLVNINKINRVALMDNYSKGTIYFDNGKILNILITEGILKELQQSEDI